MARKKIVFVIVEGPSDDIALGAILNRLFDRNTVYVEIMHGDITSDYRYGPNTVVSAIGNLVKGYASTMHFKKGDFQQVVHIVDMDGAYVPDEVITEDTEANKTRYSLTKIHTNNPVKLAERNRHKRSVLNQLNTMKKVWTSIPYQVYYMSCNLDHVLYNKLNSSNEEKENDAYEFAIKYKDDIEGFLAFISGSDFSRMEGYVESWKFIKNGLHSLERFTNLGLCFTEIREKRI